MRCRRPPKRALPAQRPGVPTGQNIAGAVTVTLTAAQVQRSEQHNLWIQGGTTTDPINDSAFPASTGSRRCAARVTT